MKFKQSPEFVAPLFSVIIIFASAIYASACTFNAPTICQAYSRAQAVFIGTVEKIEYINNSMRVTFSVERTFKGKKEKVASANFFEGECGNSFRVGEKYFVYKEDPVRTFNRTRSLSSAKSELEYAESLSEENPIFKISGVLWELSEEQAKVARVTIEKGQNIYQPKIEGLYGFSFKATEGGIYRVKIILPFQTRISLSPGDVILPESAKFSSTANQSVLQYDVEFKPNDCDFREFYVAR